MVASIAMIICILTACMGTGADNEKDADTNAVRLDGTVTLHYKKKQRGMASIGFYRTNDESAGTLELEVSGGILTIPEEIDGMPVAWLDESAFIDQSFSDITVKELVIPASVLEIDRKAFNSGLESLESYKVAEGNNCYYAKDGVIYSIGSMDRDRRILLHYPSGKTDESFTIPGDIYGIFEWAFCENDYIRDIVIAEGVEAISGDAFHNCSALERVSFPASLTSTGYDGKGGNLFEGCFSLKEVNVDAANTVLFDDGGVLYSNDKLICYPAGKTDAEYIVREGTKRIGDEAFFRNSSLEKVTCPTGLTHIYNYGFASCDALKTIIIDLGGNAYDSIYIDTNVFSGTEDNDGFSVCDTAGNVLYAPK